MTKYINAVIESVVQDLYDAHTNSLYTTISSHSELAFNTRVCEELQKKGWNVSIVDKPVSEINLKSLYHSFLILKTDIGEEIYIDPFFKSQFEIFHTSDSKYTGAMEHIPCIFIGTYIELCAYVKYMAKQVRLLFLHSRMELPPWRTQRAFLSKWRIYYI